MPSQSRASAQGTPGDRAEQSRAIVCLVDDDASMREGAARILSLHYEVRAYESAAAFLQSAPPRGCPVVLVLDMRMPEMTGLEVQERLRERGSPMPVVFISGESTIPQAVSALKLGAVDFLVKPFGADELLRAVDKALAIGRANLAREQRQEALEAALATLAPRESDVFGLLCRGYGNAEIAAALDISLHTAKQYKAQVMRKLGVSTLSELMSFADGLRSPD